MKVQVLPTDGSGSGPTTSRDVVPTIAAHTVIVPTTMMAGEGSSTTLLPPDGAGSVSSPITQRDIVVVPTIAAPPVIVPTTIVRELLTPDNYAEWGSCMKRYLKGQGLWEVCKSACPSSKAEDPVTYSLWKKKNNMALHALQTSCSRDMFSHIRDINRANVAWKILSQIANPTSYFAIETNTDFPDPPGKSALPLIMKDSISADGRTALHLAAFYQHEEIVETLVWALGPEHLGRRDGNGQTPLHYSAINGHIKIAKCMILKYPDLANIENGEGELPVVLACRHGDREMTLFLYSHTRPGFLQSKSAASFLSYCIVCKFLDIALDVVGKNPHLAVTLDMDGLTPLAALAQRPALFMRGYCPFWFWPLRSLPCKSLLRLVSYLLKLSGIKNMYAKILMHAQAKELLQKFCTQLRDSDPYSHVYALQQIVIKAVKQGNVEFVTEMIHNFPELKWVEDVKGRNIFSYAILHRQEKIFRGLLHEFPNKVRFTNARDIYGNNILHLAALLAPSHQLDDISGAALQMQREVQWYKKVESIVPPICKDFLNSDGKTPIEVFAEQHAGLVNEGEKWMKEIATSSSFVAALIVTIMFAAAFTIPGGNNDKGSPILLEDTVFMFFIAFDSLSLISATMSVLMFLGILTSQYAKQRFLKRLPTTKLITGLSSLFISIVTMMIAFCAAVAILLKESSTKVILIPIIILSCITVTLFTIVHLPLLVKICVSAYGT